MRTLAVLFAVSVPVVATAESETKTFESEGLKSVNVANGSGSISVVPSEDGKSYVVTTKRNFEKPCELVLEKKGSELVVKVNQPKRSKCEIDMEVKVPKTFEFEIKAGSGSVKVEGMTAKGEVKVGSGSASLVGEFPSLEAKSGSGEISVKGLMGEAELTVGSGKVMAEYIKAPTQGKLEVRSGSGDVTLLFPADSKFSTAFKSGSGKLTNDFTSTAGAPFRVDVKVGSGNLQIKKAQ